jgi:uncharacterized cofD-like protein
MRSLNPIKVVSIGGGTGLSTLLTGLKPYLGPSEATPAIELTAIVTVTDDGKSSGRLRQEFGVLPPGDIRNCLVALADEEHPLTRLFRHRFPGDGALGGHSLGNLILLALNQQSDDFLSAINQARQLLGIKAWVLPSTLNHVDLVARVGDKTTRGQIAIKARDGSINQLALVPANAQALPEAVEAIRCADLITFGPGSLYTSVIANLLVKGIAEAAVASPAKKLYICNAMTEFDETDRFTAVDHVQQLLAYAPGLRLDYALFNSAPISAELRVRYAVEKACALEPPPAHVPELAGIELIAQPLASETRFVRHDPQRLAQAIFEIYHRSQTSSALASHGIPQQNLQQAQSHLSL